MTDQLDVSAERHACARFVGIKDCVNANAHLVHRGRYLTADWVVHVGTTAFLLRIEQGRIVSLTTDFPLFAARTLTLRASVPAWSALWAPCPAAGWHDIFALTKRGEMQVEGQMQPLFANLQYVKDVLTQPRIAKE